MDVCVDGESEERSSKEHSSSPLNLRGGFSHSPERGGFSHSSTTRFGMQGPRSRTRLPTTPGGGGAGRDTCGCTEAGSSAATGCQAACKAVRVLPKPHSPSIPTARRIPRSLPPPHTKTVASSRRIPRPLPPPARAAYCRSLPRAAYCRSLPRAAYCRSLPRAL